MKGGSWMTHRVVEGEGLGTSYAAAPRLRVLVKGDGPTGVEMEYASSPVYADGQEFRVTRLTFERVVYYEWNIFEYHRKPSNPEDSAFGLIEISDSEIIEQIVATGRRLGGLRHYRITFDDHGTYDVVCERVDVAYSRSSDDSLYP
jgi:hypothetical protein